MTLDELIAYQDPFIRVIGDRVAYLAPLTFGRWRLNLTFTRWPESVDDFY